MQNESPYPKNHPRKEFTYTMKVHKTITYEYKNAPIPGGGYVTGLLYHPKQPGILYARTDIGGVYRYEYEKKCWKSLIDSVSMADISETFPIACALDEKKPERLYIMSGINGQGYGKFSISENYGETFIHKKIPVTVHGNLCGRGTGYRLVVDKKDENTLYFASQLDGLWKTTDRGDTWERLPLEENYMTCVWVSDDSKTIVAGTAGYTTRESDTLRGHSLYVSYDAGQTFEKLMQPENVMIHDSKMNGLVASRYDYDGTYLYVTMNVTGRWNYVVDLGYSCDSGDVIGGKVLRYYFSDGKIAGYDDITPDADGTLTAEFLNYGFGGISSCKTMPGLLVCSTLCREKESDEIVYLSKDYGSSWSVSLCGLEKGDLYFNTSYMKPEYNGNHCLLHWLSDIKINPFDPDEVWFNSGTGVFMTDALLSEHPRYHDACTGIEETVHLNVYAPVDGEVQLVDIVGDLGGFAFRNLDEPCKNSFDDSEGNRYITCINADISDADSNLGIVTARGNWKGKTKGGLVRTCDNFKTFDRIGMPFGINAEIDKKLHEIENPNVNAGWVAVSPDGVNIVWSVADGIRLPVELVLVSNDGGHSFQKAGVFDLAGQPVETGYLKVFSDRSRKDLFYGFGGASEIYVSRDGGRNFYQKQPKEAFPVCDFGYIDTANKTEVRGEGGKTGIFYLALGDAGLYKLCYDTKTEEIHVKRLTDTGDACYRMGLGVIGEDRDYLTEEKAIYFCGRLEGEYGFYRTFDEGKSYERLNQDNQMYGEINSIDGDKRKFGRFFLATGSRGVLYGEMKRQSRKI